MAPQIKLRTNDAQDIFLTTMVCFSQLVDKVFACRICPKSYGFSARSSEEPYYKFPPIIGKTHDARLLFVGINPRIDDPNKRGSNRPLHDALMRDKANFLSLSANKVCGQPYIALNGEEWHYRFHVSLVNMLFGNGCDFENFAAVTEIFLCATENTTGGLPGPGSECAERYLGDTMRLTNPQVIVAVGKRVMDYFRIPPHKDWPWNHNGLTFDGRDIPVVEMFHPADRKLSEPQKARKLLEMEAPIRQHLYNRGCEI